MPKVSEGMRKLVAVRLLVPLKGESQTHATQTEEVIPKLKEVSTQRPSL